MKVKSWVEAWVWLHRFPTLLSHFCNGFRKLNSVPASVPRLAGMQAARPERAGGSAVRSEPWLNTGSSLSHPHSALQAAPKPEAFFWQTVSQLTLAVSFMCL